MSAVNDTVSSRLLNNNPATLHDQPPLFGKVAAVDVGGVPTRIIWLNGVNYVPVVAAIADLMLDTILAPTTPVLLGQYVIHITGTNVTLDPSGGTSREYDGRVVQLHRRRPIEDDQAASVDCCIIMTDHGTFFEDRTSQFVALPGR